MAKLSMVRRDEKRKRLELHYRPIRDALKQQAKESYKRGEIPWDLQEKFEAIPRNASLTRLKNRCGFCGRSHGFYRRFGMCRLCVRKFVMQGMVAGWRKSSW